MKSIRPDQNISKISDVAFRAGSMSAATEKLSEHYRFKQEQEKALKEKDYFKEWGITKY